MSGLPAVRRVTPVSMIFLNHDECAPGPSHLGTGNFDTIQAMNGFNAKGGRSTLQVFATVIIW